MLASNLFHDVFKIRKENGPSDELDYIGIILLLKSIIGFLNEKDYNSQVTTEFQRAKVFC